MARVGIGFVSAVALVTLACTASTRSGKAASGASGSTARAAETGRQAGSAAAASAGVASADGATKEVEGRVELIDRANNVTLSGTEAVGHAFDRFKIDEDTEITVNGEQATIADVSPGDEARASFSGESEELRLERLEIVSPAETNEPSEPADSPHER